jgi:16S rRNA processing protein RimM
MTQGPDLLEVGRIAKAHGLRGEVFVDLVTDRAERLEVGSVLASDRGDLEVASSRRQGGRFVVRFAGVETREGAERLRGVVLRAERLEDPEAVWVDQLFGARVESPEGHVRGTVVSVEAAPASDLLILDTGDIVPLTFVTHVVANELVVVDGPEGLFA